MRLFQEEGLHLVWTWGSLKSSALAGSPQGRCLNCNCVQDADPGHDDAMAIILW